MTEQKGLSGYDGIVGMSPQDEKQNGPSYVKSLYEQGIIADEVVTFWLNLNKDQGSYVTLGGVPLNSTTGNTFTQDLIKRYDQWWTVYLHDVEYGGKDIKDSGIGFAILDTGTSLLYLGEEDYANF